MGGGGLKFLIICTKYQLNNEVTLPVSSSNRQHCALLISSHSLTVCVI